MEGNITLTIIKPGAVRNQYIGPILNMINESGFKIIAIKMIKMSLEQAGKFYAVHRSKPFYESLTEFMSSGPIVVAILEKENAVEEFRKLIGATNPAEAEEGTIRHRYAESIERNAVHGSDSEENAVIECDFFFSKSERLSYL
ncbi:MAG: nucleoside diphosphate kinase [Bacteroides sp. SM23_62_1]|nr:MAG: nucleoside diphosphate kinase [Bacteroides sp. SM23_62_1]